MRGVKNITYVEDSGPLVHIDKHDLPDLDDLMLEVYAWYVDEGLIYPDESDDEPTRIPYADHEAEIGYFRKDPSNFGDFAWMLGTVPMDDEGQPLGRAARGAFMGVYFRG